MTRLAHIALLQIAVTVGVIATHAIITYGGGQLPVPPAVPRRQLSDRHTMAYVWTMWTVGQALLPAAHF